ncbi:MAG: hypothetical protein HYV27_14905 [Candidatus Hydrogenedentes bacterium]|nr:hypothetical protein [Candidatus Hydrogenedentota bacterium]
MIHSSNDRLQAILEGHFDTRWGTPFWCAIRPELAFDPLKDIRCVEDLEQFPPFPTHELATRPVTDFIPRRLHGELHRCITSETGGTTGAPCRTVFLDHEFLEAFVTPFVEAARLTGFPRKVSWLFIGPSGPHIIGKAARACATALDAIDPFMVDFDPRWVRKLPPDSMGRSRYMDHIFAQADAVLRSQDIGVLFSTPPVLRALGARLDPATRERITGVHLGGMAADQDFWQRLGSEWFPNAVALSGYGNSLAGVSPQIRLDPAQPPEYFPHGSRLLFSTQPERGSGAIRLHRLDDSTFMPNVHERDEAELVDCPQAARAAGFQARGLRDPRPPASTVHAVQQGLY